MVVCWYFWVQAVSPITQFSPTRGRPEPQQLIIINWGGKQNDAVAQTAGVSATAHLLSMRSHHLRLGLGTFKDLEPSAAAFLPSSLLWLVFRTEIHYQGLKPFLFNLPLAIFIIKSCTLVVYTAINCFFVLSCFGFLLSLLNGVTFGEYGPFILPPELQFILGSPQVIFLV